MLHLPGHAAQTLATSVAWLVATAALLGGPAHAADKAALGHQIAEAMVDIARHGNLHDVAYTRVRLPLPFALTRELSPQSNSSGAAIQYYQLTLTRAQRGTMTMTYLVASRGTLDPESDGTLTSYLHLENLSDYACITTNMLTGLFGSDDRPARSPYTARTLSSSGSHTRAPPITPDALLALGSRNATCENLENLPP